MKQRTQQVGYERLRWKCLLSTQGTTLEGRVRFLPLQHQETGESTSSASQRAVGCSGGGQHERIAPEQGVRRARPRGQAHPTSAPPSGLSGSPIIYRPSFYDEPVREQRGEIVLIKACEHVTVFSRALVRNLPNVLSFLPFPWTNNLFRANELCSICPVSPTVTGESI